MRNGKEYGVTRGVFRERWWNFYERGCSFAEGGFWDEAITEFKRALQQREYDSYRARTYGMHFIDYFPHRELGIAFYHRACYQNAVEELSLSLSQVETAKAKYFITRAREKMVENTLSDTLPPVITHLSLREGYRTNLFELSLEGVAEDDTFISAIAVNGSPIFMELAEKKVAFNLKLPLTSGDNEVCIEVKDVAGKITTLKRVVVVDREGPLVAITEPLEQVVRGQEQLWVKGFVYDASEVASFIFEGEEVDFFNKREGLFIHEVKLAQGMNKFSFEVKDGVGNLTRGEITLFYRPQGFGRRLPLGHCVPMVHLSSVLVGVSASSMFGGIAAEDSTPPVISLKELTDEQTVYLDTVFIEGSAEDQSKICEVTINSVPLHLHASRHLFFNYLAQVKEGVNCFEIRAKDVWGNTSVKSVTVTRKLPQVKQVGSRFAVAVLPFEQRGEPSLVGSVAYDTFLDILVNQGRFNVVGRQGELEAALGELKLSQTMLVDDKKALGVGKIVSAEGMMSGRVVETPNSIEICVRLLDTETGSLLLAKDVFEQKKDFSTLQFILKGLALKFERNFPLLEGSVVKSDGVKVYIDRGMDSALKKGMKVIVFRESEPLFHPVSGSFLGRDTILLAEARITEVFEKFSVGNVMRVYQSGIIRVKDGVITK